MLEKETKPKEIDRILKYVQSDGNGKNPIEFTNAEREKWAKMSYCHNLRKKGYSRTIVRDMLMKEYPSTKLNMAYCIIRDTELVIGPTHVSAKDYDRAIAEEMILDGYRMALSVKDVANMGKYIDRFMKLKGVMDSEDKKLSIDSLQRHTTYLSINPEDVGMERYSIEDIRDFVSEMSKTAAPKVIPITPHEDVTDN